MLLSLPLLAGLATEAQAQIAGVNVFSIAASSTTDEGDSGTKDKALEIKQLSGGHGSRTNICISGAADLGSDYDLISGTGVNWNQHFTGGDGCLESAYGTAHHGGLKIRIKGDKTIELDETVVTVEPKASAGNPAGATVTATHTIKNDDGNACEQAGATVRFAASSYRAAEGQAIRPELVLSCAASQAVTVLVVDTSSGATAWVDYDGGPYSVTFPAGTRRQRFDIPTKLDGRDDDNEQFSISDHNLPVWLTRTSPNTVTVVIDQLDAPTVRLGPTTPADYTMTEGVALDPATLRVTLDRDLRSGETVTVALAIASASGVKTLAAVRPNFGLTVSGDGTASSTTADSFTLTFTGTVPEAVLTFTPTATTDGFPYDGKGARGRSASP